MSAPSIRTPLIRPRAARLLLGVLWLAVLGSAMGVVLVSHLCRQLYSELAVLEQQANEHQVEWGQYLLEQSSWASLSRIEQVARENLGLRAPEEHELRVVRP